MAKEYCSSTSLRITYSYRCNVQFILENVAAADCYYSNSFQYLHSKHPVRTIRLLIPNHEISVSDLFLLWQHRPLKPNTYSSRM